MPTVSVIMPVYNVERFVAEAVHSVLTQTFEDFELLIIDDCSPDRSIEICREFDDDRIRIIQHPFNRGLAGARNTGIRYARGKLLAFLDSDDFWHPHKLEMHMGHLAQNPQIGISFSRSEFVNEEGNPLGYYQMPKLRDIEPGYYLCRNPIGNGSAPVIRREVFDDIRYLDKLYDEVEDYYFDENFRQSEDIECWVRIAICTDWVIEGISPALTYYRLNAGGLSASLLKQLASWEAMVEKLYEYAPRFIARHEATARAFQLRYLARQAIRLRDGKMAVQLLHRSLRSDWQIALREPTRTLLTAGAAYLLWLLPENAYLEIEKIANRFVGSLQSFIIDLRGGERQAA